MGRLRIVRKIPPTPLYQRGGVKKLFLVVTPVKTGVQEVSKELKILDSGLRRNDGKRTQINFSTPSGGQGGI
jgi:hypothetical protein